MKRLLFIAILVLIITGCSEKPKKKRLQRCFWQPLAYACGGTETEWVDPQSWFNGYRSGPRSQGLD